MSKPGPLGAKPTYRSPEQWVRRPVLTASEKCIPKADQFTSRLTLDITPELHKRIKLTALANDRTAADLLRAVLEREFGAQRKDAP